MCAISSLSFKARRSLHAALTPHDSAGLSPSEAGLLTERLRVLEGYDLAHLLRAALPAVVAPVALEAGINALELARHRVVAHLKRLSRPLLHAHLR